MLKRSLRGSLSESQSATKNFLLIVRYLYLGHDALNVKTNKMRAHAGRTIAQSSQFAAQHGSKEVDRVYGESKQCRDGMETSGCINSEP